MATYSGHYTDGKTGQRLDVTIHLGAQSLHVTDKRGATVADWPYERLRLVEEVYADQPVRLKDGRKGAARLTIANHRLLDELPTAATHPRRRDFRRSGTLRRAAMWIAAIVAVVVSFIVGLPIAAEPIASALPLKWEEALGRSVQRQALTLFASKSKLCEGAPGRQALNMLVTRLGKSVPSRYTFRIVVVDSKLVNAFAVPGGYIVVFRGLIDESPSADGLAGVLAHEMGHVIERHGTESLVKTVGLGLILSALIGDTSSIGSAAAGLASDLLTKSYSREAEREADAIGVTMLNRANISGAGFAQFFRALAEKQPDGDGVASYFATHPSSRERADRVAKLATGTGPAMTAEEWKAVQAMCS